MARGEIVLPITDPETEWVRGRALRKVSPTRDHSRVQGALVVALDAWNRASSEPGEIGPEWRFRLAPAGEPRRPLVPDVAFVRADALRDRTDDEIQAPAFPPAVAFEVLSPGDDPRDVAAKVDAYLRAGVELALVVDPRSRTVVAHDARGVRRFARDETFVHAALPGFALRLEPFFGEALDRLR